MSIKYTHLYIQRRFKLNKFKEVFQFLAQYGGTGFISDAKKKNYDEERYNNITNLKVIA